MLTSPNLNPGKHIYYHFNNCTQKIKIEQWDCTNRTVIYSNYSSKCASRRILFPSDSAVSIFEPATNQLLAIAFVNSIRHSPAELLLVSDIFVLNPKTHCNLSQWVMLARVSLGPTCLSLWDIFLVKCTTTEARGEQACCHAAALCIPMAHVCRHVKQRNYRCYIRPEKNGGLMLQEHFISCCYILMSSKSPSPMKILSTTWLFSCVTSCPHWHTANGCIVALVTQRYEG